jgi:hypothetical protein
MAAQPIPQQYQYIKLPDGSYGKFDANATDDEIREHIQQDFPSAFPQHITNTPGASISAAPPRSMWDRARDVVANSAVGRSLEEGLPKVADALNLHPTETVNSPNYQSDRQQLVAPQYLMPNTSSIESPVVRGAAHVARGLLTGTGKLTSGNNLATGAAIAATSGLAAPILAGAGAGGGAAAARLASTGAKLGFAGMGAKGVYDDATHALDLYKQGRTDDALETAGAGIPNAALTLPLMGKPIEGVGDFLQDKGVDLMDSYLKAGKKAYRYDAEPGRGILEQGPGTSIGLTREGFANGVEAAKNRVGGVIPGVVDNSTAQIPRGQLQAGQDAVLRSKTNVLNGPGGDRGAIPALEDLRDTMSTLVDVPGNASPREVYDAKRNMDENINWGRDLDPKDATVNNTRRAMRSDLSSQLYDAVPELAEPSRQYGNLSSASKLANDRTFDRNGSVFNPFRIASMIGADALTQGTTHNTGLAAGVGLATGILPEIAKAPVVKTGGATALYQMGRGIAAAGRGLSRFALPAGIAGAEDSTQYGEDAQPSEHDNQRFSQNTPPNGAYRRTSVTPEIIRPGDMSRSRFGIGQDGRAGVLIRPLGSLPAPGEPIPEATPYTFGDSQLRPLTAIPARSPERLLGSIGASAHTLPESLLGDVFEDGTPEQKASALRRAKLGPYGDLAPQRLLGTIEPVLKDLLPRRGKK